MKTIHLLFFAFLFLLIWPACAQDSLMVKKPVPTARPQDMPTRRGKGMAQPMPNPRHKSRIVPMRPDTNSSRPKRDTVK